ncbi:MAG: transglutaminase-like domain-containing protein [Spirulinaceae cyanobacterium]
MNFSSGRQNFKAEVQQSDEKVDLAKAALYLAQEEYPQLPVHKYLDLLDKMAGVVIEELPAERYPLRIIQTINRYLYQSLGFQGNSQDYYNPCNSFLNDVLEKRQGIPITLSLVYLEIARRIGFPMVGIGMPGHFLIRPDFAEAGIFVDAFNQGEILFEQDCQEKLNQLYQQPVALEERFFAPVTNREFLQRMLSNLKHIYLSQHQLIKALTIVERILLLVPNSPQETRDRGIIYYQLGELARANQDLQKYLDIAPQAEDLALIVQLIEQIKQS